MSASTSCDRSFEQRIAYARGLLDEVSRARFESHLAGCDECRNALEALRHGFASSAADPEHLPPSLVAEWETATLRLRGIERRTVREHLAECEECRNLLQVLGLEATLPDVPDLEATDPEWLTPVDAPGELAGTEPAGPGPRVARAASRPVGRLRLPRITVGRTLGVGGWAVAAAMIAMTLWRGGTEERASRPIPPAGPGIRATSPAPVSPPAPSPRPTPGMDAYGTAGHTAAHAQLLALRRGVETPEAAEDSIPPRPARIGRDTGWITVPFPDELWRMAPDQKIEIEIRDPWHRPVFSATLRVGDLDPQQELVWPIAGQRLVSGTYELRGRAPAARGGPERTIPTRRFEVVVDPR